MDKAEMAKRYALELEQEFGYRAGSVGSTNFPTEVTSTGCLDLDFTLGTGGWPYGHIVEIFGPPDIGKSSGLGLPAIANAQEDGKLCAIVALEPNFDSDWAFAHGVDPDTVIIGRPDNGLDAFHMLHKFVHSEAIDMILFDSIGAILRENEAKEGANPNQGGQSALITWGVKAAAMPAWKKGKSVILINQIRDDMKARVQGLVDSPGGHALKHACSIRVQLKPGKDKWTVKENGDDVISGRQVVATVKRNKLSEGTGKKATFNYWQKPTVEHDVGIDMVEDVINAGKRSGVIKQAGAWYYYDEFPENKSGKKALQGKAELSKFLTDNGEVYWHIRDDVLDVMKAKRETPA